ncbi:MULTISPECIES: DUF485 domain-containing protein [Thermomonosporaceae]|uniref:DUF485 domain-containing protein n=1 Tax=Thermomonosporaceae TaxID=2012 RepID=UPI00255A914E|nr:MULTISPECIES: DUF485 domain-containing protein [Thermomonosporaceae]MDL4772725.1 DUF485 domain-containing protein [Actinomadura xylanilytica]
MVWDSKPSPRQGTDRGKRVPPGHYAPLARDERFQLLKKKSHRLALAIATSFLGWYFLYVGLSAFARGFMARPVAGNVNVAILLGVLQIVSTFLLAWAYAAFARQTLDPLAAELRAVAAGGAAPVPRTAGDLDTQRWPVHGQAPEQGPGAAAERRDSWPGAGVRPDLGGLG